MSKKFSAFCKFAFISLISLGVIGFCTYQASALTDEEWDYFNRNGIRMYNPSGVNCSDTSTNVNVTGGAAAEKVWNGLISVGFTSEETAAMMGNIDSETGGTFNPFIVRKGSELTGTYSWDQLLAIKNHATGLMQWLGGRRKNVLNNMPDNIKSYFQTPSKYLGGYESVAAEVGENNYDTALSTEIAYIKKEIDDTKQYQEFKTKNSIEDMAYTFCMKNESPGEAHCRSRNDGAKARKYYDLYKNLTSSGISSSTSTNGAGVTIIGDSLTVGIADSSKVTGSKKDTIQGTEVIDGIDQAYVDAKVGRFWSEGLDILKDLEKNGKLTNTVVFALGTNNTGGITEENINDVYKVVGPNRKLFFVTNYTKVDNDKTQAAYKKTNKRLKQFADDHSNVAIIDYAATISADPDKYINGTDHIHNTAEGKKKYRELITNALGAASSNSAIMDNCNNYGGGVWTVGDLPWYRQCDSRWGGYHYALSGIGTNPPTTYKGMQAVSDSICNSGCGPSSLAMLITAILGKEVFPSETTDIAGKAGQHKLGEGSLHSITKILADHYNLQYKVFDTDRAHCKETVNQALEDGWMIHTSGTGSRPFSSGGHMIGIAGLTSDGKWLIANSGSYENKNAELDPDAVINAGMNCNNLKGIKK